MRGFHCPRCCRCTSKTCRSRRHVLCSEHRSRPGDATGIAGSNEFDIACLPCGEGLLSAEAYLVHDFVKQHRACTRDLEEE